MRTGNFIWNSEHRNSISSLSGAATTKATLAWLGGGSLASGGFWVLGGSIALRGLFIAPVVLFSGLSALSDAEDNLTEAAEIRYKVEKEVEKMETMKSFLERGAYSRTQVYSFRTRPKSK